MHVLCLCDLVYNNYSIKALHYSITTLQHNVCTNKLTLDTCDITRNNSTSIHQLKPKNVAIMLPTKTLQSITPNVYKTTLHNAIPICHLRQNINGTYDNVDKKQCQIGTARHWHRRRGHTILQ